MKNYINNLINKRQNHVNKINSLNLFQADIEKEIKKLKSLNIKDVFKQFQKERHAEDKGKNFNLLQEVYAKTELFDISSCKAEEENISYNRDSVNIFLENMSIDLPFESCFIKVNDTVYVFIREFEPTIITGSVYVLGSLGRSNVPFVIRNNELEADMERLYAIAKSTFENVGDKEFFENLYKDYMKNCRELVISGLVQVQKVLNSFSKRLVMADIPTKETEYFRRKHEPTIKVNNRPIYYVLLGKKATETKKQLDKISPIGRLEPCYRFRVRGHWRNIDPKHYGKDRNGEYVVKGFTWVVEHEKGHGELVKKLHVIN